MIRWSGLLVLACVFPAGAPAQDSAQAAVPSRSVSLSLAEALQQARANSPMYRQFQDGCTHYQIYNRCANAWDARIYWTTCQAGPHR